VKAGVSAQAQRAHGGGEVGAEVNGPYWAAEFTMDRVWPIIRKSQYEPDALMKKWVGWPASISELFDWIRITEREMAPFPRSKPTPARPPQTLRVHEGVKHAGDDAMKALAQLDIGGIA